MRSDLLLTWEQEETLIKLGRELVAARIRKILGHPGSARTGAVISYAMKRVYFGLSPFQARHG